MLPPIDRKKSNPEGNSFSLDKEGKKKDGLRKDEPRKTNTFYEKEASIPNFMSMTYAELKAYREKQRDAGEDQGNEEDEKSCFSEFVRLLKNIFFVDSGRILKNANASKREMEAYDIQRLPQQFRNEPVSKNFKTLYAEWEKQPIKTPMWRVFLKMEKRRVIISSVLRVISDIILILIPLMMIQYESAFHYQTDGTRIVTQQATLDSGIAIAWACVIFCCFIIQYMCRQHSEKQITVAKFRLEQALKDQLFKKLLNADYISIAESDPNQVSKILFFGIDNIMAMFTAIPAMVSSPIAIALGAFLVARAHSNYFFLVAIILYLLICFVGIDYFNGISAKYQAKYDNAQSLNSIKVEEFFDNITTIQTNSLGLCLKDRFYKIRKMANDTLKYLHLATGIAEVILSLSPFIFTAIAVTIFHYSKLSEESESDSTRLMVCALAPMTIPIKVITDSLYKRRLFISSFALVLQFLDSLREKAMIEDTEKNQKAGGKIKSHTVVVRLVNCSFLRDNSKKETFATIINPKKEEFKENMPRFVLFKNPDTKGTLMYEVKFTEEERKNQAEMARQYNTGAGGGENVNYCLKNLSLKVTARMKVCIVGDENSGVSDFFLALMKELLSAEGSMILKGTACYLDMNNPKFIRDTIKENILLGRPANKELYTILNELVGLRLSKYPLKDRTVIVDGQKNIAENDVARILLARLLYSEADLVLMNSYFDYIPKERQIPTYIEVVEKYLQDKTVIFSTSCVHLIKRAEKVVVMKDGMIVENDTYLNLISKRDSQLYKYLMTDPAGNTNLFRKVLDQYKINLKKKENEGTAKPEDPQPSARLESPLRKRGQLNQNLPGIVISEVAGEMKLTGSNRNINDKKGANQTPGANTAQAGAASAIAGQVINTSAPPAKPVLSKAEERQRNQKNRKRIAASEGGTAGEPNMNDLGKLQRNIMYNSSLSTKVVFLGQSSWTFYMFFLSLLITNIAMALNLFETSIWGSKFLFLESYDEYLIAYDLLVFFYIVVVIIRDGLFSKLVINNLNHLYNLLTNSLIETQKEYLLVNPSTRIVYLMTKIIAKIDRDLIRSYYKFFDSIFILLVILGVLNYFLYIFMAIISIFWMIIIIPTYGTFNTGCVKLSIFTTNYSSDLVEVFLSSFNFILPLRNHNISDYFSKKFQECADTVMRAKIRLEDDILRWFHLRYMIYSTILIMSILFFPIIVVMFLSQSYLTREYEFRFVSASVPVLLPVLLNFANSLTETSFDMICVKSIIKYVLELSKNSEDASIIKQLAAKPAKKNKYVDEEEVQEANLIKFILKKDKTKQIEADSSYTKIVPSRAPVGPRSGLTSTDLYRSNTQVPGEKKRSSPNEPTKPLIMLKNVIYESKIGDKILDGINLKVYEAERIGIVCEVGSGKDFLINLLMTLIQKTDIPERGPSVYEIRGTAVTLETSAELRKNMRYLYPDPSLLMGTVRDNIDPFGKYTDEDIARTLHFLKIVRALQEYSRLHTCADIEVFLKSKQNAAKLNEVNLEEIRERITDMSPPKGDKSFDRFKKNSASKPLNGPKIDELKSGEKLNRGGTLMALGSNSAMMKAGPLAQKGSLSKLGRNSQLGGLGQSRFSELKPRGTLEHLPIKDRGLDHQESNMNEEDNEEGAEEFEDDPDFDETKNLNANSAINKREKELEINLKDPTFRESYFSNIFKQARKIFFGKNFKMESKEEEQVRMFFEKQFINKFPIPMPIPERAKRLDEDLDDFDMDYENHLIHFEDEKKLLESLLHMEVGQNGKNLNEDCRKIIMMAKVYLDKPSILILDEEALYIKGVNVSFYIKQLFTNLKECGILSIVKDLRQLYLYSSVAILKGGKIIEQDPPLDLIDNKESELYKIVVRDDVRTLRQLENKLDKNIRRFEKMKRKELQSIKNGKLILRHDPSIVNNDQSYFGTANEPMSEKGEPRDSLINSPRLSVHDYQVLKGSKSSSVIKPMSKSHTVQNYFNLGNANEDSDEENYESEGEDHVVEQTDK
jgi:ABC-type multidrug transport system fused ATPase/permease subunit